MLGGDKFRGATVLITGGTGSFGERFLARLLDTDVRSVRIFSRDEAKQEGLAARIVDERVDLQLGDVRDFDSVLRATDGVDFVFHAAALKQVPAGERFPEEFYRTNVLGTENVIGASYRNGVRSLVALSTDKAVEPSSSMGMTKALMERVLLASADRFKTSDLKINLTRFGNVVSSRGSVVPKFASQVISGSPLTVTHSSMTRYLMTLDDAIALVMTAFSEGESGQILVQKSKSFSILVVAKAVAKALGMPDHEVIVTGVRPGEKLDEALFSPEELRRASDCGDYVSIHSARVDEFVDLDHATHSLEPYLSSSNDFISDVSTTEAFLMRDPNFANLVLSHNHKDWQRPS